MHLQNLISVTFSAVKMRSMAGVLSSASWLCRKYLVIFKVMVVQSRKARKAGHRKYLYALVSAEAIYYELRDLGVAPLPPARIIHFWLKQAGEIEAHHRPCKASNPTYPVLPCKAVNDVHELDLKDPFSLQEYYLIVVRDVFGKKVALRVLKEKPPMSKAYYCQIFT